MVSGILLKGKRRLDALAMEPGLRWAGQGVLYGGGALVISAIGLFLYNQICKSHDKRL